MRIDAICKTAPPGRRFLIKTLLMTKLTAVLLVTALSAGQCKGYSQKVTLSENDVSLKKGIQRNSPSDGLPFFLQRRTPATGQKGKRPSAGCPSKRSAGQLFQGQPLEYEDHCQYDHCGCEDPCRPTAPACGRPDSGQGPGHRCQG